MGPKEAYSFAQVKEIVANSEDTMMKFFNSVIDRLENKITNLANENNNLKKEVEEVKKSMTFHSDLVEEKIKIFESNNNEEAYKQNNEVLLDKVADLEDRSRRNNLRFSGLAERENETWEQSEQVVRDVIEEKLGLPAQTFKIERAHRCGNVMRNGVANTKRTIMVKFLNYKDKKEVLDAFVEKKLWSQKVYVNEDFSERTVQKRKQLFTKAKELREKGFKVKVIYNKLVYVEPFQQNAQQEIVSQTK